MVEVSIFYAESIGSKPSQAGSICALNLAELARYNDNDYMTMTKTIAYLILFLLLFYCLAHLLFLRNTMKPQKYCEKVKRSKLEETVKAGKNKIICLYIVRNLFIITHLCIN